MTSATTPSDAMSASRASRSAIRPPASPPCVLPRRSPSTPPLAELAGGHALDRHHAPVAALLQARARGRGARGQPLLPEVTGSNTWLSALISESLVTVCPPDDGHDAPVRRRSLPRTCAVGARHERRGARLRRLVTWTRPSVVGVELPLVAVDQRRAARLRADRDGGAAQDEVVRRQAGGAKPRVGARAGRRAIADAAEHLAVGGRASSRPSRSAPVTPSTAS